VVVLLPAQKPSGHLLLGIDAVRLSTCLFPKGTLIQSETAQALQSVERALRETAGPHLVLMLRSGRFAAGIFRGGRLLEHKTVTEYTVRRGQGGAQSAQDSSGRKPKSVGSSLRRAGEVALREKVAATLLRWQELLQTCTLLLLVCPKTMRDHLFGPSGSKGALGVPISDERVRFVPFPTQRPTLEEVKKTRGKCMEIELLVREDPRDDVIEDDMEEKENAESKDNFESLEHGSAPVPAPTQEATPPQPSLDPISPLGIALRSAIMLGDLPSLLELLANPRGALLRCQDATGAREEPADPETDGDEGLSVTLQEALLERDGDGRTPLHLAANPHMDSESSSNGNGEVEEAPSLAEQFCAEAVAALLGAGANPGTRDWRSRTAYQVAFCKTVRDAFRRYRGQNESQWDWDGCGVAEGTTEEKQMAAAERRKAKAKEKKRRQRQRKKEQTQLEKTAQDAAMLEEVERKRKEEEDEQLRAAGAPKCDACGTPFRPDDIPFFRMDYQYCSTKCISDHKRVLVAEAAARRLGR